MRCKHGVPMQYVRKMWTAFWVPSESCESCAEIQREAERMLEEETDRMCESARRRRQEMSDRRSKEKP